MDPISIPLPSLIHRVGGSDVARLKVLADNYNCHLKRIRRSRNWVLTGLWPDIQCFCDAVDQLNLVKEAYLLSKIIPILKANITETPIQILQRLLVEKPHLTIAELAEFSGCELVEVRRARIELGL
ncbi:ribosome recycling factor family protein [Vibrio gallicus]|uniref:ribosome recycling factor family protein n=1 Tax=Vibrio gallicus TaxID=190897 RepID=UPI0021C2FC20|nr:ribosome recycling factor family protein [Vibrio gallicus]